RTTSFPDLRSRTVGWSSTSGDIPTPSNIDPSGNKCRTAATLSIMPFSNCVKLVDEYDPAVVSPAIACAHADYCRDRRRNRAYRGQPNPASNPKCLITRRPITPDTTAADKPALASSRRTLRHRQECGCATRSLVAPLCHLRKPWISAKQNCQRAPLGVG